MVHTGHLKVKFHPFYASAHIKVQGQHHSSVTISTAEGATEYQILCECSHFPYSNLIPVTKPVIINSMTVLSWLILNLRET